MIGGIRNLIFNFFLKTYWKIGFVETKNVLPNKSDLKKIKWVKFPYNKKWYADPFILEVNNNILSLLVEEYEYDNPKGVITLLEINIDDASIQYEKRILSLDTHLSFPAIFRKGDKVYVYPENSRSGNTFIYEYDGKNKVLKNKRILVDLPLADAVIYNSLSGNYIFATSRNTKNGNKVEIYKSINGVFDKYELYQIIMLPDCSARNAGNFLMSVENNAVIKVSQENNSMYGHAIVFQELNEQNAFFSFNEVLRLEPFEKKMIGIHTYNRYMNFTVIDAKFYMHSFCGPLVNKVITLIRVLRTYCK